jgi:GNAT superfamily N-acetyltransferase
MTVAVRPATPADLADATACWNAHLGSEFPLVERVLRLTVFDDPTFRAGDALAAVDGQELVGFAWLKRSTGPVGCVGGIVVRPDRLQQRVGSMLLRQIEHTLNSEGVTRIDVSGGLLHLLPGIPSSATAGRAVLEHRGYTFDNAVHVDLTHDLAQYVSPRGLPSAAVRVAADADVEPLLAFLARAFPGNWERHARWHLHAGGSARDFVLLEVAGQIEGFCRIYRPDAWPAGPCTYWSAALQPPAGGLGPIGVSEPLRGRGLGSLLLDASLLELKASGVRGCAIDWTRLVHFYGAFGFRIWRTYARATKPLTPPR